jgi:hypothetical protein
MISLVEKELQEKGWPFSIETLNVTQLSLLQMTLEVDDL